MYRFCSSLKEAEIGVLVKDVCRKYEISDATCYNWKTKYGVITWKKITSGADACGAYNSATVPVVPREKRKCLVKVIPKDSEGVTIGKDISDLLFTIQP